MKGLTFTVIDLYILLTKPGLSLTISIALSKYFFYLALADDQGYGRNDPDQKTYRTIGLVFLFGGLFTLLTPVWFDLHEAMEETASVQNSRKLTSIKM